MNATALLREQLQAAGWLLAETVKDVTPEQAHRAPDGKAHPIGALYAHTLIGVDFAINGLGRGGPLLIMGEWGAKAGLSEPPPQDSSADWTEWGRRVRVDLNALGGYAKALLDGADSFLAGLNDADLDRKVELPFAGFGPQSLGWIVSNVALGHLHNHTGEISALKGVQGGKGYPF